MIWPISTDSITEKVEVLHVPIICAQEKAIVMLDFYKKSNPKPFSTVIETILYKLKMFSYVYGLNQGKIEFDESC